MNSICPECGAAINSTGGMCNCGWHPNQRIQGIAMPSEKRAVTCPKCNGETVVDSMGNPEIFMPVSNGTQRTCPTCAGRGYVVV